MANFEVIRAASPERKPCSCMKTAFEFIALAAIWGGSFLLTRIASLDVGPWVAAAARVLIGALCLLPWVIWQGQLPAMRKALGPVLLVGVFNAGIPFALYSYAVLHISTGLSAILNATTPLFGALVAWWWLQDKPPVSKVWGLVIGFAGVSVLSWQKVSAGSSQAAWAILACLCATLCYGISASFTKKYLQAVPPMATAAGSLLGACLALAVPAVLTWPDHAPQAASWAAMLAAGAVCTGLAYVMFFRLIARTGPSKTLTVTFLIPVFALLYGSTLLGETITPWMMGGGVVILVGVSLATGLLAWPKASAAVTSRP